MLYEVTRYSLYFNKKLYKIGDKLDLPESVAKSLPNVTLVKEAFAESIETAKRRGRPRNSAPANVEQSSNDLQGGK